MSRTKILRPLALAVVVLQAGCMLGPDYVRPADGVPASFSAPAGHAPVMALVAQSE